MADIETDKCKQLVRDSNLQADTNEVLAIRAAVMANMEKHLPDGLSKSKITKLLDSPRGKESFETIFRFFMLRTPNY